MDILEKNHIKFLTSLQKRKYRSQNTVFLAEGILPVLEAKRANYKIKEIYYTPHLAANIDFDSIKNFTFVFSL